MKLAELQKALRAAEPGAVLVAPGILERIIRDEAGLRGRAWGVPHRKCYVTERQTLFRHAEQADLDLGPDQLLPDTVLLLARPRPEELSELESQRVLLKCWRRLFHACVHLALEPRPGAAGGATGGAVGGGRGDPLPPERLARRIEQVGRTEFEEIRTVLAQDHFLLPGPGGGGADDRAVYVEFAAVYLETRRFAPPLLGGLFPGLRDPERIDRMLAEDVDADALFARARPAGAPDPVTGDDAWSEEPQSHDRYWALVRGAERASRSGNAVLAAILRTRAWRVAPAENSQSTRDEALAGLRRLSQRLAAALGLAPAEEQQWAGDLPLLLDKADQQDRPAEARLLYDLQRICLDHEREIYTLDLVEWALSAGKRPVRRPLPSLRPVRLVRNLRSAAGRLGALRLSETDRQHLCGLLGIALARAEEGVHARFSPVLSTALQDVGLCPANPPERVAFDKMVAEWLDRIMAVGFLTFGDLRDGVSRNQLKLSDLREPRDFTRRDPLLRLDRRLSALLDGVYRPGEFYVRALERVTALNFGTRLGRALTLWVTLPFAGAFVLLQVLGVLLHLAADPERRPWAGRAHAVLVGPYLRGVPHPGGAWHFALLASVGLFLAGLIHSSPFRRAWGRALAALGRGARAVFIDGPAALFRLARLRRLARSWPLQLLWWYALKPALAAAALWLLLPPAWRTPRTATALFLAAALLVNSRFVDAAGQSAARAAAAFGDLLRAGLLRGVYRLIVRAFKQAVDSVEFVLFTVDDWLRFRTGDSRLSLVVRTVLGALWFPISYLARFYMVVLVEPGFNPIKAPVSYVAAKVMLPLTVPLTAALVVAAKRWVWDWLAYAFVLPTVWLLPDAFGFLFWETKENWSLYRANRPRKLGAAAVGPHGETIKALLQPGFHSGTVPRLYAKLRRAERGAYGSHDWDDARAYRRELEEIGQTLGRFVSRELVAILRRAPAWQGEPLSVGRIDLAVNRVGIELTRPGDPSGPLRIVLELRRCWLLASLCDAGWLGRVNAGQAYTFAKALAGLYKLAGVDLVREQVAARLPPGATWEITPHGLAVRFEGTGRAVVFSPSHGTPAPPTPAASPGAPACDASRLVFACVPLTWDQWLVGWEAPPQGPPPPGADAWDRELIDPQAGPDAGAGSETRSA